MYIYVKVYFNCFLLVILIVHNIQQAHKKYKSFLNKSIDHYDEIALVVSKDMTTESFVRTFADIDLDDGNQESVPIDHDNEEIDESLPTACALRVFPKPTISSLFPSVSVSVSNSNSAVKKVFEWIRKQSKKMKILFAVMAMLFSLVALKLTAKYHNHFFVASESIHAAGILVLIYKLTTKKTCSGLSLKSQELTAIYLAVRVVCSFNLECDIHTLLDFATFLFTAWVIFMIRFKLKSTYIKELDNFPIYYMVVPCAILAMLINPRTAHIYFSHVLWAFCVYLEAVSVMPQLRMMQNAKMIEPFTAHYVFALGMARFLACAHWIIQVYETGGRYLFLVGYGYLWFPMAILAEIVQTFILVDFCYYYIKSFMQGQLIIRMPV
ncbi:hypothetical protein GOBAR_AA19680 [Gossypium barbadense]|uniref:ER lumen protein retaining receptor n=1 Tax=Gossypium barbadense TaxID=3634 RepID=A0A2P5XCE4_GOSBA|nr:hypothetical protein GOBAR_AA19680 [Gossypium barbadense]